ncbi:MAG: formate dehydrogenase accessory sulfurtransferase FdhD [Methanosarcinaceae archaeon]|nr:formate dehydrogenase accessory sulfurtransferase FdhD [Methanosarcinaceae archaeon]
MRDDWHANRTDGWKDYWKNDDTHPSAPYATFHCMEITEKDSSEIEVDVIIENKFKLIVNGVHITTFFASPVELRELAVGFLLCEGLLTSPDELNSIEFSEGTITCDTKVPGLRLVQWKQLQESEDFKSLTESMTSIVSDVYFNKDVIFSVMEYFRKQARSWRRTGGTHSSIVCDHEGDIISFCEDVSRSCSIDKAVGKAALCGVDLDNCALMTTGRLSSVIVGKAVRAGFPLIASKAAPVSDAIKLAEHAGITLVAFARKPDLYVYTRTQRVR